MSSNFKNRLAIVFFLTGLLLLVSIPGRANVVINANADSEITGDNSPSEDSEEGTVIVDPTETSEDSIFIDQ